MHRADDRKLFYGQHAFIFVSGYRDDRTRRDAGAAYLIGNHHTLIRFFGQAPVHQLHPIEISGILLSERQAVEAGDDIRAFVDIG